MVEDKQYLDITHRINNDNALRNERIRRNDNKWLDAYQRMMMAEMMIMNDGRPM